MRFAINTLTALASGSAERRADALVTFGLWFAAGAFVVSTGQYYLAADIHTHSAPLIGGLLASAGAAAFKLS